MAATPFVTSKPPPVADRPRCPACSKPLKPVIHTNFAPSTTQAGGYSLARASLAWHHEYKRYGAFCTLRCCETFANAAYRAGYRITKEPKK